ncbi:helix-turn-helix domain-containing protein [Streptomyces noboritoensis]|uniref:Helix-turn-helix domain-containing protein n=1 Tax=Streptomyces noboritoensis TaxID=67337 RepID=A0ABV6T8M8_9ACTN
MPRPREFEPDAVVDQAMLRFWLRGYRATSVEDLVKATGVKPGSLYGAFPGGKHTLPEIAGAVRQADRSPEAGRAGRARRLSGRAPRVLRRPGARPAQP